MFVSRVYDKNPSKDWYEILKHDNETLDEKLFWYD